MNGVIREWSSFRNMSRVYKQLAGVGAETIANQPRYKVQEHLEDLDLFGSTLCNVLLTFELVVVDELQQ